MIRRAAEPRPGNVGEPLFPSAIVPVCAPALASSLQKPGDLADVTLIRATRMPDEWSSWLAAAGLPHDFRPASEVTFEDNSMAMQAAIDGIGVAIAQLTYVRDALAANRLVAPLRPLTQTQASWRFEYRNTHSQDRSLCTFRDWLADEATRERAAQSAFIARTWRER